MRLITLLGLSIALNMHGQFVIPDSAFAARLNFLVPSAMTGNVLDTLDPSVAALTDMTIFGAQIERLDGVRFFSGLQTLDCSNNYLDTLPELPANLIWLDAPGNQMEHITMFPPSLTRILIQENQLTTLPPLPAALDWLICYDNNLISIPPLPSGVTQIACSENALTGLPALPSNLERLLCRENPNIGIMPALPASLDVLDCGNNGLSSLPTLPASLTQLSCPSNSLTVLPPLPPQLIVLGCNDNPLTGLPTLPNTLVALDCQQTNIGSLPTLPASLRRLDCWSAGLSVLPPLPSAMNVLDCQNNNISVLPTLPDSLTNLTISNNNISLLPALPDTLRIFYCMQNNLTALPSLPQQLEFMNCSDNQIGSLPALPDSMTGLFCNNNPLACLPVLPNTLENISCSGTGVACLPNVPTSLINVTGVSTTVCNVNTAPCAILQETITGQVFNDVNGNGMLDAGEPPFSNTVIQAQPGSLLTAPDVNGDYVLPADTGSFVVDGQDVLYHTRTTTPYNISLSTLQVDSLNHIGYQAIPGIYDLVVDMTVFPARPGFDNSVYICVENIGTETTAATMDLNFDGDQGWISSDIIPDGIIGTVATWTDVLAPGDVWGTQVQLSTNVSVPLGTDLTHIFSATPASSDTTPVDNQIAYNGVVVGSYDPNDKLVSPGVLTPTQVQNGPWLDYTIRFQNTGTFPAVRVVITDTLSADLEWSSFEFISSSHSSSWYITNGVLHFVFDPIFLPDSVSDEPNSHGYAKFRIKPINTLMNGDMIENIANIYFDFNEPVITDPSIFTVDMNVGYSSVASSELSIYPNPVDDVLTIRTTMPIKRVLATGIDGRRHQVEHFAAHRIHLGHLTCGIYLLFVEFANGTTSVVRVLKN